MTVDETLALVQQLHAGQYDKGGEEYWRHPVSVMNRIPNVTEHEQHVALLHDVIEDTPTTPVDLLELGYSFAVVWDVNTLTRPKGFAYPEWIEMLSLVGSPAAIRVKLADIEDNLDPQRLGKLPPARAAELRMKYAAALPILRAAITPCP